MNLKRSGVFAIAAVAALTVTACSGNTDNAANSGSPTEPSDSGLSGTLQIGGASSTGAAREAWEANFQQANPQVTINYASTGSGAGRKNFIDGAIAFAGSDAYLKDEELAGNFAMCAPDTKAIDIPIYISPIAIAYNLDGVDELKLDAATTAKIFLGEITKWNDDAIAALNPGANLPDLDITAVHRSDESGTTKNFTQWLHDVAPEAWPEKPSGEAFSYGEGAEKTQGVLQAVSTGTGTIGYLDFSATTGSDLGIAEIQVGEHFQAPTPEAAAEVLNVSEQLSGRSANDIAIKLDRSTTAAGTYPLVLVSYAIACEEYADADIAKLVKAYLGYIVSEQGQQDAHDVAGTAPLSGEVAKKAQEAVASIQ